MKGFGRKKSKNKKIKNLKADSFKEQIIHKAFKFHSGGNISEAIKYYQSFIKQGFKDFRVFSNYGFILIGLGKFKEAELLLRKAIELKPDYAEAHLNLGNILKHLGQLEDAKLSYHKAIELKPDLTSANYSISTLQYSNEDKIWRDQLFSDEILNKKSKKSQVDIYFARANILHKEKKYDDSSKFLQLANNLKFDLNPFDYENFLKKSRTLLLEMDKKILKKIELKNSSENTVVKVRRPNQFMRSSLGPIHLTTRKHCLVVQNGVFWINFTTNTPKHVCESQL